jgi:hypothetical protein
MIVFDLICRDSGHRFEGWFGSSRDYESQHSAGLISCPTCGAGAVDKAVMAPNVGIKANRRSGPEPTPPKTGKPDRRDVMGEAQPPQNVVTVPPEYVELVEKIAKTQAKILEKSKWVGTDFPEQARAIHYGEKDATAIHGMASADEVTELQEEGIELMPLPLPVTPPKAQN